jgi:hypothetical protein
LTLIAYLLLFLVLLYLVECQYRVGGGAGSLALRCPWQWRTDWQGMRFGKWPILLAEIRGRWLRPYCQSMHFGGTRSALCAGFTLGSKLVDPRTREARTRGSGSRRRSVIRRVPCSPRRARRSKDSCAPQSQRAARAGVTARVA